MCDPEYEEVLTVPASALPTNSTLFSLDKGCSLTKVLVGQREDGIVRLICRTYKNCRSDSAIDWLASTAKIQAGSAIKITGVGGDKLLDEVAARLKCRACFVDEFAAQQRGLHFLLRHATEAEVFHADPKLLFEGGCDASGKEEPIEELFPVMFTYIGSGTGISWVDDDEKRTIGGGSTLGGKAFLGLAKLLLGTTNFKEINELAERGDRAKANILENEATEDLPGATKNDRPLPFGRLAEDFSNKENLSREDKAISLITFFSELLLNLILMTAQGKKGNRLVVGGNLVRSRRFRECMFTFFNTTADKRAGKTLKFLRTGHTAAIGLLLLKNETN